MDNNMLQLAIANARRISADVRGNRVHSIAQFVGVDISALSETIDHADEGRGDERLANTATDVALLSHRMRDLRDRRDSFGAFLHGSKDGNRISDMSDDERELFAIVLIDPIIDALEAIAAPTAIAA